MEKLKVIDNGVVKKIEYTEKYATGIFLVLDNKKVKNNCKILNIDLGENISENEIKQRVTKLEKTGLLTIRIDNQHFQYIFKDYADKFDVDHLVLELPQASREALTTAYNLTKINNLDQLDLLGGIMEDKN